MYSSFLTTRIRRHNQHATHGKAVASSAVKNTIDNSDQTKIPKSIDEFSSFCFHELHLLFGGDSVLEISMG